MICLKVGVPPWPASPGDYPGRDKRTDPIAGDEVTVSGAKFVDSGREKKTTFCVLWRHGSQIAYTCTRRRSEQFYMPLSAWKALFEKDKS